MGEKVFLTAKEVALELGISITTLYAYVSRGLIRSEPTNEKKRSHRYYAEDVQKLKIRKEHRKDPAKVAESALHFGSPVLESAITFIQKGRFHYCGYDVLELTQQCSVEQVAQLIWTGELKTDTDCLFHKDNFSVPPLYKTVKAQIKSLSPIESFQVLLPILAAHDLGAYDFREETVRKTGARVLRLMVEIAAGVAKRKKNIAETLQQGWIPKTFESIPMLNTALILCADHELNVSSFTARCVASGDSTPYAVVLSGLAALQGAKHGGYSERVEALFREVGEPKRAQETLVNRLKRGESIPGFFHPLYPEEGDPRGRALLDLVIKTFPNSPQVKLAQSISDAANNLIQQHPILDFGLVTLARTLQLPAYGAITLFALGRTIGWIGHALEQYSLKKLIRPRARYIGELPRTLKIEE